MLLSAVLVSALFISQSYYRQQSSLALRADSQQLFRLPSPLSSGIPGILPPQEEATALTPESESIQSQTSKITTMTGPNQEIRKNINLSYPTTTVNTISNLNNNQIIPRTFLVDSAILINTKQAIKTHNNAILQSSLDQLLKQADEYLSETPVSVVEKTQLPPSGDKHDYLSLSKYWWPDRSKPNGLPYIRHDGKVNPEYYSISDKSNLENMIDRVKILSLSYYFTGNEQYASKAVESIRTWFLDDNTYMNPNLNFAQIRKGYNEINPAGIIDARNIPEVIDGIGLIQNSTSWTVQDQSGITRWFQQYLSWLLNSNAGRQQSQAINNHGTWYDAQLVPIALFLDKPDLAKSVIEQNTQNRLINQIEADGSQPLEIQRTKSLSYSIFNLAALFELANTAKHVQVDLWNYKTANGVGLRNALNYLMPYLDGSTNSWPHKQIAQLDTHDFKDAADLLYQAAIQYNDPTYEQSYNAITQAKNIPTNINNLLYGVYH